jgi:hypothetical protein
MARMHPEDIDFLENATPGERVVFRDNEVSKRYAGQLLSDLMNRKANHE